MSWSTQYKLEQYVVIVLKFVRPANTCFGSNKVNKEVIYNANQSKIIKLAWDLSGSSFQNNDFFGYTKHHYVQL